jgi:hypothetical protein
MKISEKQLEWLKANDYVQYVKTVQGLKDYPTLVDPHERPGINVEVTANIPKGRVHLELFYPPRDAVTEATRNKIHTIEVGLCDVRATDSIRIRFDFERSGWAIYQQVFWEDPEGGSVDDVDHWHEVSFIANWQQQHTLTDEQYKHWCETQELPPVPEVVKGD